MTAYSVREVAAALGLPSRTIYSLVRTGFVEPVRGPRRQLRFSFQDILALKTAHGLMAAAVSRRRVTRAIAALRRQLPAEMPLAGLRIRAIGDRVVVQERAQAWEAETGQGLLSFEVTANDARLHVIEGGERREQPTTVAQMRGQQAEAAPVEEWFAEALALEEADPDAAIGRYSQILAANGAHTASYINCGRLLHEARRLREAERLYRTGLERCGACALLCFNLGVLLEDLKRPDEAIAAYQQALECDPEHCDSHYNLARIFEGRGRIHEALQHFNRYRSLTKRGSARPRAPGKT